MAKKAKKPGSELKGAARLPLLKAVKGKANPAGPFADLTWTQQRAAEQWLWKFCKRWEGNLPPWRRGILIGVARRLAKNPPPEKWGLSFHRCRGGLATARKCRESGVEHPGRVNFRLRWVA
jgi:hypothetical protein